MKCRKRETSQIKYFWDKNARWFDSNYESTLWRWARRPIHLRHEAVVTRVRESGKPTVLDVGCGGGRQLVAAILAGAVGGIGIDLSPKMILLAQQHVEEADCMDRIELRSGDVFNHTFKEQFDIVWALGVFDYLKDPRPLLDRMMQLSRGRIIATFRRFWAIRSPLRWVSYRVAGCPIYLYRKEQLEKIAADVGLANVLIECPHATFYCLEALSTSQNYDTVSF